LATGGSPWLKKANRIGITAVTTAAIEETMGVWITDAQGK
jgi:hypothetical protein